MDTNQTAEKDEFEYKQKELEGICAPIVSKLYQQAEGTQSSSTTGGSSNNRAGDPTVEEVD